jgi:hypothetical protein
LPPSCEKVEDGRGRPNADVPVRGFLVHLLALMFDLVLLESLGNVQLLATLLVQTDLQICSSELIRIAASG